MQVEVAKSKDNSYASMRFDCARHAGKAGRLAPLTIVPTHFGNAVILGMIRLYRFEAFAPLRKFTLTVFLFHMW